MFQISGVKKRYFEFEAPDNLKVLHIEPPKLKTLNKLQEFSRKNSGIVDLAELISVLISRNKEGRKVTRDLIMLWMDYDQLAAFIEEFVSWMKNEKQNDPN